MKLLLDQNISFRLARKLHSLFPGTQQVNSLGLIDKPDRLIWEFARKEGFTIVTFDSDFYDLSLTQGHPPKLIWIKSGNATTENLYSIFSAKANQIHHFTEDKELSCLEIVDL